MAAPMFDAYVMVDWSAASGPGREAGQADGLWAAVGEPGIDDRVLPFRTRAALMDWLIDLLDDLVGRRARVLCGLDVAFGYPVGTAAALGAPEDAAPWRWTWELIAGEVSDGPDNRNDRFAAAGRLNARISGSAGPFWGRPASHEVDALGPRKPGFPVRSSTGVLLDEWRAVERHLRARGAAPKSVWQVAYAGAVGGQTLTALPALLRVVADAPFAGRCSVWPFETGLRAPVMPAGTVLLAEVYPSLTREDPDRHDVRDARQVLALVDGCRQMDARGALAAALAGPSLEPAVERAVVDEEGWILPIQRDDAAGQRPVARGALRPAAEAPSRGERFTDLIARGGVRIEEILSSADVDGATQVQPHDEWVLVLDGRAVLDVAGETMTLAAGDWVDLPAGTPHRVVATAQGTRWLAVHREPMAD